MASLKIGGMSLGFSFLKTKLKLMRPCRTRRAQTRPNKGQSKEPQKVPTVPETTNRNGRGLAAANFHKKTKSKFQNGNKNGRTRSNVTDATVNEKASSVCSTA